MRIDFVHCWDCRLPATPSGRHLLGAPRPVTPEAIEKTCAMMRALRLHEASERLAKGLPS